MIRFLLVLIGYGFGLIQSGYFYGKRNGIDIRTRGSGNVGATNTLRVFGWKAGVGILLLDFLKCFLPCLVTGWIFRGQPVRNLYVMYMALGVLLGHNFPVYLGFRGGKGVASAAGMLYALDWRLGLLITVFFALIAVPSRLVSLASILSALAFIIITLVFGTAEGAEFQVLCVVVGVMVIWRHASNIERLLQGKESKIQIKRKS